MDHQLGSQVDKPAAAAVGDDDEASDAAHDCWTSSLHLAAVEYDCWVSGANSHPRGKAYHPTYWMISTIWRNRCREDGA